MFDLYGDENAQDGVLLSLLTNAGVDFLTSNEAGNRGKPDDQQLEFCAVARRVILTFDRGDFQRLHSDWMRQGRRHAGIIIVSRAQIHVTDLHIQIMRLQAERTPEQMDNALLFIGPTPLQEPS